MQIHYIAPEVINKFYNSKCDIWSLGILLFVLLSGNAPFVGKEHDTIIHKILNEPLHFANPVWKTRSSEAKSLIARMLEKNFEKRVSIGEILNDPWICRHRSLNVIHKPEKEMIVDSLEYMQKFTVSLVALSGSSWGRSSWASWCSWPTSSSSSATRSDS